MLSSDRNAHGKPLQEPVKQILQKFSNSEIWRRWASRKRWKDVGEVHGEFFDQIRPALTMIEIARLIDDAALIEIEADAIVHSEHKEHI